MTSPSAASPARGRRRHAAGRTALVATIALLAACSSIPPSEVQPPEGRTFIPMVPDSVDDVGLMPSVAVDGQGLPAVSYFGFTAALAEGEIPTVRPVGAPFLTTEDGEDAGAVLLAGLSESQIWNRGAVAQPRETPSGLTVPYDPAAEPSLASLTRARAKGTDLAIAGTEFHAAWTADTGVWYGLGPSFEVEPIEETPGGGAPSIVIDGEGTPIVAFAVAGAQPDVRVAERTGERWQVTSVTTLSACGRGCPPAVQMTLLGEDPLVVAADPASGDLIAAHREGGAWSTEVVASDVTGGAAVAAAGDAATISFYTSSGVSVATGRPGQWSVAEVAPVRPAEQEDDADGPVAAPTTGVAVADDGTAWVVWEDVDGVHLASGTEGQLEEVDLHGDTAGGVSPTVAVTEDGASVYVAWYDPEDGDLGFGSYADIAELKIAAPSPPPVAEPADVATCGEDGEIALDVVAVGNTWSPPCLVAPAAEPFAINVDNQDATVHNLVIATDIAAVNADPIFRGPDISGPAQEELPVEPIDAGEFVFQCTYHPATMTGAFVVVEGSGGGGGGNGGGGGGEGGGG